MLLFYSGKLEGVALWLAFKVAAKWRQPENQTEWARVKVFNLSLIGELVKILFGVLGAVIIRGNLDKLIACW